MYFKKKEEQRVKYKRGRRCTQANYIIYRRYNLKQTGNCRWCQGNM